MFYLPGSNDSLNSGIVGEIQEETDVLHASVLFEILHTEKKSIITVQLTSGPFKLTKSDKKSIPGIFNKKEYRNKSASTLFNFIKACQRKQKKMYPGKNYTSGGKSRHPDPLELVRKGGGDPLL